MKAEITRDLIEKLFEAYGSGSLKEIRVITDLMCESEDELEDLERLAEIGRATEKLLSDEIEGYMVSNRIIDGSNRLVDVGTIDSVEQLLEWYGISK